jgi:hypothetical protein
MPRQDTLFTINLPLVNTKEELEKIKNAFPDYDPYFIVSGCERKEIREKFDNLWRKYREYADTNFLDKIKKDFHQRSWEMYVGNVLLKKGLNLKTITPKNEGPDCVIVKPSAYIECVAPTEGDPTKADSVPREGISSPGIISANDELHNKMILRITNAIGEKEKQYNNWTEKNWFDPEIPLVIAINAAIFYRDIHENQNISKALYCDEAGSNKIVKSNGADVAIGIFTNQKSNFISGVLFSKCDVLNHPEKMGDDCSFFNNPYAKNPIDRTFVELFMHWTAMKKDNQISLYPPKLL